MTVFDQKYWRLALLASAISVTIMACSDEMGAAKPSDDTLLKAELESSETLQAPAFTEAGLAAADAQFAEIIANQHRAGIVAVFSRHGQIAHISEHGWSDIASERPMTANTVVRIASMTKPVTALAIMMLIEDGVLSLETPVSQYIASFANIQVATQLNVEADYELPTEALERDITIKDLLTHTSGLGYVFDYETNLGALYLANDVYPMNDVTPMERMDVLAGLPFYAQPGQAYLYSFSNDVLGVIIAEASGQSLEDFFQTRIFRPLGMANTSFYTSKLESQDISTGYTHNEAGELQVVEGSGEQVALLPWEAGGAGLFSTANDYLKFAQMLANGGELDGTRIVSQDSINAMSQVQVEVERMPADYSAVNLGFGYSLGVTYAGDGQTYRRPGDFGWTGYFDTAFVVSPSTGVVGVIMSQEAPGPTTPQTIGARTVFEKVLYEALPDES